VPGPDARTSGLAIASLVLGLLSFFTCFVTAIPAIILGIVGLVKISKSGGQLKGNAFAIAGIAVPSVSFVFLLPIMMAILMPAPVRTRAIAYRVTCGTNMSALGKAMVIYACDNDDMFPTPSKWCDLLTEHAQVSEKEFTCPGAPEGPCNYAMNKNIEKLGMRAPPDMVVLFETHPGWNQSSGPEILTTENHNGQGCNILFIDSHVAFIRTKNLKGLKW
jgi:prepilin-type processing-associated H-X9-DG protein